MSIFDVKKQDIIACCNSTLCPACGNSKENPRSFCIRCYRRLPVHLQNGLRLPYNRGYMGAWRDCMTKLGRVEPFTDETIKKHPMYRLMYGQDGGAK